MSEHKKMNTVKYLITVLIVFACIISALVGVGILLNQFIKKDYRISNLYLIEENGQSPYFLLCYKHAVSRKSRTTTHYILKKLYLQGNTHLSEDYHQIDEWNWSHSAPELITKTEDSFVFRQGEEEFFKLSKTDFTKVTTREDILKTIYQSYPQIKEVYQTKLRGKVLSITTETGSIFYIDLETLKLLDENTAKKMMYQLPALKYIYPQKKRQDLQSFKNKQNLLIKRAADQKPFAQNYTVIDEASQRMFFLDGDPRRTLLEIMPDASTKTLDAKYSFLKGEIIRPQKSKGRIADTREAIFANEPLAVFIRHHSNMDEEKSSLLISKIDCDTGQLLFQTNLSQEEQLGVEHYAEYCFLFENQLIMFLQGDNELNILSLDSQSGKTHWRERLAY